MAGLCEGGNEPLGSLKDRTLSNSVDFDIYRLFILENRTTQDNSDRVTFSRSHETKGKLTTNISEKFILECERPKIMFTKLEQRSWIKIEVARGRSAQECFQGLREACDDAALP
ncbi:hypothetical protein ANN_00223 [Periplaneta americana]|uniref:Uncharacterized protein n=1 Tax=Periplaneta americana TaxID=6978 RepID=A0ABQ8TSZ4_PERAM|nr:hypothetical protein ANN_00223 [Periplaneta americana]